MTGRERRKGLHIVLYALFSGVVQTASHEYGRGGDESEGKFNMTIRMPDAVSDRPDALLCHALKLPEEEAYILKYEPHATKNVAHHMMVYGCGMPGSQKPYWPCGEMDDLSDSSVCSDGERDIVYAWALDAPGKEFPKGVGFRVSGQTRIKYLVIQLHYKEAFKGDQTDNSGITLHMTTQRQPKQAGFYVHASYGEVPPHTLDYHVESACMYKGKPINAIAYRTHSHNLGKVTSGYRVRDGNWREIGRMSPQLPQTFYNVTNGIVDIRDGDILASRCTMNSNRSKPTKFGPANKDEMCNFYIMYYTEAQENLSIRYCMRDANKFKWTHLFRDFPDKMASSLDGLPKFVMNDPYAQ